MSHTERIGKATFQPIHHHNYHYYYYYEDDDHDDYCYFCYHCYYCYCYSYYYSATSTTTATTTTTVEKTGDAHHDIRKPANIFPCTQADKMNVVEQFTELVDMTSVTISNAGWDQTSTLNYATAT